MKISEIKAGMRKIDVTGKIAKVLEVKATKAGTRLAHVELFDDSGTVVLTVWEADVDRVAVGKTVTVENGFAKDYKGTLQFSAGQYGKLLIE